MFGYVDGKSYLIESYGMYIVLSGPKINTYHRTNGCQTVYGVYRFYGFEPPLI